MSQENLNAFYEHGLAVVSAKKIGDLIKLSNIQKNIFNLR